jgi:hypothetical protein
MSSFRDKFKSKIKSKQDQPETMESFDENALNVTLTQAKTQLVELRVTCQWVNKSTPIPPPKLHCKWYNRTEHNIQEIIGIEGETYQPSVIDVGSMYFPLTQHRNYLHPRTARSPLRRHAHHAQDQPHLPIRGD